MNIEKKTKNINSYVYRRVSEGLLFNTMSTIFKLYHGENKNLHYDDMMISALYISLSLFFIVMHTCSSLKQQSQGQGRHVLPLGPIMLILSQPVFALTP